MGARRSGREAALQMLFQLEASRPADAKETTRLYWQNLEAEAGADPEGRAYADEAVDGVARNLETIDAKITEASTHWRLERMSRVDRNILRLSAWELSQRPDIPRAVILDEAVELAKSYGTEDSSSFVNGVLDRIAETLGRRDADR